MERSLLIVGAGVYAQVAAEIAADMGCFAKIGFVDDKVKTMPNGTAVAGTTQDIARLAGEYTDVVVAIGNPQVRLSFLERLAAVPSIQIAKLISPRAYISPSASLMEGCIVEPMAVVHTDCVIGKACIISAGAVINHTSTCGDAVHVDCNATVAGYTNVPTGLKIAGGTVYRNG